ncbi:hypothetical protein [Paenibacillus mendelii]|uniref:DUF1795 domain-containing protein n=1 Tax=Paenibacillus mendelii TaxID=206163 RepID=A0ABV6JGF8_9BACL|nr:hypothetical protein [Paenibacillus mendelii]MCQ6557404.1 hypothetical protein [Paenibacillus mendelii]
MKQSLLAILTISTVIALTACSGNNADPKNNAPAANAGNGTNASQPDNTSNKQDDQPDEKPEEKAPVKPVNDKLELKKVLDDKVGILIPKGFTVMSEEMAAVKYPSENRPTLIYTNEEGSINVSFNHTETPISDNEIPDFTSQMKPTFESMYPDAAWSKDEVVDINGNKVGVFELTTPAVDTKIYNLIFFTELDGKLLMVSFNCTESYVTEWQPLANEILNSLKTN